MTTYLLALGLIFIAAAAVGGGLRAGNVQIPIITTKFGNIALCFIGIVAIGLGVLEQYWEKDSLPRPALTASNPTPRNPSGTGPQIVDPGDSPVDFQAAVTFAYDKVEGALDLDFDPPIRVNSHNIFQAIQGEPILGADPDVLLAERDRPGKPTKQQCVDQLAHHAVAQTGPLVTSNAVCLRTSQGRIGNLLIMSTNNNQIRADVTIWK